MSRPGSPPALDTEVARYTDDGEIDDAFSACIAKVKHYQDVRPAAVLARRTPRGVSGRIPPSALPLASSNFDRHAALRRPLARAATSSAALGLLPRLAGDGKRTSQPPRWPAASPPRRRRSRTARRMPRCSTRLAPMTVGDRAASLYRRIARSRSAQRRTPVRHRHQPATVVRVQGRAGGDRARSRALRPEAARR